MTQNEHTTNHIIIEIDDPGRAQDLFEEIQNKYCFYDNCVLASEVPEEESFVEPDRQDETDDCLLWRRK